MSIKKLLLIEDDASLRAGLSHALKGAGYQVEAARTATEASAAMAREHFEVAVLDLGLPDADGITWLRAIRDDGHHLPVVVLTARDAVEDRVRGLDAGADDYVVKPFALDELKARIRAAERRGRGQAAARMEVGALSLDTETWRASLHGRPLELSRRQFALLAELCRKNGRVASRAGLETAMYGWSREIESNAIEVHVHALRRKLPEGMIETVRGVGYRLVENACG